MICFETIKVENWLQASVFYACESGLLDDRSPQLIQLRAPPFSGIAESRTGTMSFWNRSEAVFSASASMGMPGEVRGQRFDEGDQGIQQF